MCSAVKYHLVSGLCLASFVDLPTIKDHKNHIPDSSGPSKRRTNCGLPVAQQRSHFAVSINTRSAHLALITASHMGHEGPLLPTRISFNYHFTFVARAGPCVCVETKLNLNKKSNTAISTFCTVRQRANRARDPVSRDPTSHG